MIKGVVFHFDTLNVPTSHPQRTELVALLAFLSKRGVQTAVCTTTRIGVNAKLAVIGLSPVNHEVTKSDVGGVNKGSPRWIEKVCDLMGTRPHELLYVGGGIQDWRTAINTPVFYIQGTWNSPMASGVTAFTTASPLEVATLIEHFFDRTPTYAYQYDGIRTQTHIRCMLPNNVMLPGDSGGFSLQDVFTYDKDQRVGGNDARHLLMFSLLTSLYSEGLLNRHNGEKPPVFVVYPSSNPVSQDTHFDDFMVLASKSFHGQFKSNALVRHTPALDTSLERYQASQEGRPPRIGVLTHANTVNLNEKVWGSLENRLVVVLDDFCNTG